LAPRRGRARAGGGGRNVSAEAGAPRRARARAGALLGRRRTILLQARGTEVREECLRGAQAGLLRLS